MQPWEPKRWAESLPKRRLRTSKDLWDAERGLLPPEKVRRITVPNALVDTGATLLSLPTRLIRQLGLSPHRRRRVISSTGATEATVYDVVRLTIQDRDCPVEVMEVPDEVPVLIGQVPLENLDLVVDLRGPVSDRQPRPRRRAGV